MPIQLTAITPEIGAEVTGVELARPLDAATVDALRAALLEHLVLLFREQPMTPEQQIALARAFGEIQRPPVKTHHGDNPDLNVLDQTSPRGEGADSWHADHTYTARPAMGSILRAVRVPPVGGDTLFASMYAAYDALSEPMQRMLCGLTAEHDITRSATRGIRAGHLETDLRAIQQRLPPVTHPVVRTHPETGRKALFVNRNSTVRICELAEAESAALLHLLFDHVHLPEFQVRWRWAEDSVAFLDNRCTQHYAVADYAERRILHRVTIAGDAPF